MDGGQSQRQFGRSCNVEVLPSFPAGWSVFLNTLSETEVTPFLHNTWLFVCILINVREAWTKILNSISHPHILPHIPNTRTTCTPVIKSNIKALMCLPWSHPKQPLCFSVFYLPQYFHISPVFKVIVTFLQLSLKEITQELAMVTTAMVAIE